MRFPTALTAVTLFANALAAPANHVRHEKRGVPLNHVRRRVESEAIIPIRIALKQSNLETGHDMLMDVSSPQSPNYGKHMTAEQVHAHFAPADETVALVKEWLLSSGLNHGDILHYENKGWLAIDVPARHAEKLFSTEYYEHDGPDAKTRVGCDEYYLPARLAEHIDFIKPGVKLSAPLKKRVIERGEDGSKHRPHWPGPPGWPYHYQHHDPHGYPPGAGSLPPSLQHCDVNMTITCIKALYNIPDATKSQSVNVMGLYESYDAFSQADLDLFFKHFAPNVPQGTTPTIYSVDGGTAPVAAADPRNGGESDIDIDIAYGLIYPQTVVVYEVDDLPNSSGLTNKTGYFNDFLDAVDGSYCKYTAYGITGNSPSIDPVYPDTEDGGYKGNLQCGTYPLTRVVSISYGEAEITLPIPYTKRQCNEIMKLGLQGHSLLVASGDYGVASFPGSNGDQYGCLSNEKYGENGTIYNPDNLSGCPYMTSVGATRLYPGQTVKDAESAMQVNLTAYNAATGSGGTDPTLQFFASSGGFSNYYTPPEYQKAAVDAYLATHNTLPYYIANKDASNIGENGGVYNRAGRGWPDVSANGAFLEIYNNETLYHFFGTSLSSPIFGSVLTLINEERTAVGKGPVGFVNPVLYENPHVLNDITNGSNPNCGSSGFYASKGWDPVTGLGTPSYPRMLELFMKLP
ncbi:Aorsin [Acrodontium crateriforme]|uniref:Aorsin n=1 Tax=Acrodontium crateriforme TaxID=150365 RepID=A0AAQ3MBX3_9PEZI|nr:Aorsin [Acrodontium crateriforme]